MELTKGIQVALNDTNFILARTANTPIALRNTLIKQLVGLQHRPAEVLISDVLELIDTYAHSVAVELELREAKFANASI